VVATLADGTTAEDLRYYNAPKYLSEETVQAVELYTTVLSKNKPVTGLSKEAFSIFEDGVPQAVEGSRSSRTCPSRSGSRSTRRDRWRSRSPTPSRRPSDS